VVAATAAFAFPAHRRMVRVMPDGSPARSHDARMAEGESVTGHEFDLVLTGLDIERDMDLLDAFEGRVSDVTFAARGGVVRAAMERTASSLGEAIRTAIEDVESLPGVRVVRVEPEDHVSQAVIASRLGRSRQSVSQLVSGARGPGSFPAPAFQSGHVALWRWSEVVTWARAVGVPVRYDEVRSGAVVRVANALLEARNAVAGLDEEERASLAGLGSLAPG
jgi:hypothetical protein